MYVIGIDEVGRGALAGPVVVGVVCIPERARIANRVIGRLKDSKKLSARERNAWFHYFQRLPDVRYVLARVYPRQIEKRNISRAANVAAFRAYRRLTAGFSARNRCKVFLDGGLYLNTKEQSTALGAKTVIRGDEKIRAIAVASIIAKVSRDRLMKRLSKKHPRYGFEIHKGYGTKAHRAAVRKFGPSPAHRLTFLS